MFKIKQRDHGIQIYRAFWNKCFLFKNFFGYLLHIIFDGFCASFFVIMLIWQKLYNNWLLPFKYHNKTVTQGLHRWSLQILLYLNLSRIRIKRWIISMPSATFFSHSSMHIDAFTQHICFQTTHVCCLISKGGHSL